MKSLSKKDMAVLTIYSLVMLSLYISFLIMDWREVGSYDANTWVKYTSIIVSTVFTLYLFIDSLIYKKDIYITLFGLIAVILTLISDYFLLVKDDNYLIGVIIFSFAQISSGIRIHLMNKNKTLLLVSISIRVVGLISVFIVPFLLKDYDLSDTFLYTIIGFYFLNLVMNFIISSLSLLHKRSINILLLSIGLLLFIACDICVGLSSIKNNYTLNDIAWIFYLPSQYLIAISLLKSNKQLIKD